MPVSTRSQISGRKSIELRQSPDRCKSFLQNPHQDLKEKMKSLTLLYEQQKQALALRHHPSIDLLDSSRTTIGGNNQKEVMKNKDPNCFLKMEAKENKEPGISDRFAAYSMPRNVAAAAGAKLRRASMGSVQDGKGLGSKIMVFVRLRPMGKKGEETGSRTCVKIDNKRDVYLTEFASEKDYLRLKRVRGRHFCFDASFPESTSQQEVYSTT